MRHRPSTASTTAAQAAGRESNPGRRRGIREHFHGEIRPVRLSLGYQVGLALTAFGMLLLPLAYFAMIAAVAWLVYLHAVHDLSWFESGSRRPRGLLWIGLAYGGLIFAGCILILFMIKPIFARRGRRLRPYTIEVGQEPVLYEFAEAVADAIGAPRPRVIEVTCEPNAAASFRGGLFSLLSDDLVLTIGMPLVAGMNMRQLAGVIAHELGHFSQRAAMRFTYIIDRINGWFARVVYQRDAMDEWLEQLQNEESGMLDIVVGFTRLCVWFSRRLLHVFMLIGHGMSCFLLRHMEFNADLYEARLAGSAAFAATSQRMMALDLAMGRLAERIPEQCAARRLADNFPEALADAADNVPVALQTALTKLEGQRGTKLFDTHPPTAERIRRATAVTAPGVFQLEQPCAKLFRHYDAICKWVSIGLYSAVAGRSVSAEHLVPVEKTLSDRRLDSESMLALRRYAQGMVTRFNVVAPRDLQRALPRHTAEASLRAARAAFEASHAAAQRDLAALDRDSTTLLRLQHAQRLLAAGVRLPASAVHLPDLRDATLRAALQKAESAQHAAIERLTPVNEALRDRLSAGLQLLLHEPEVAAKVDAGGKLRPHVAALMTALAALRDNAESLQTLSADATLLMLYLKGASGGTVDIRLGRAIESHARDMHQRLTSLYAALRDHAYPLEHANERLSIAAWCMGPLPPSGDLGGIGPLAAKSSERLSTLTLRILGRLCMIAEKTEACIGLPRLEHAGKPVASHAKREQQPPGRNTPAADGARQQTPSS